VHAVSGSDAWAVGVDGEILRWKGLAWHQVENPNPVPLTLHDVHMLDEKNGWMVGVDGTMIRWREADRTIHLEPGTLDWGSVPFDYPRIWNTTTITNVGTDPLTIESIALNDYTGGAFRVGRIYPRTPYVLGPGESGLVTMEYHGYGGDPGTHDWVGRLDIVSDDPRRPRANVTLVAYPAPASGVSTYLSNATAASSVDGNFSTLIDPDGRITDWSVKSRSNVFHYTANLTDDRGGLSISGQVANKDAHAQMILEVKSTSSPEKLELYDIIIVPYHLSDQDDPYPIPEGFHGLLLVLGAPILLSALRPLLKQHDPG
jgi:hypothetical protein